MDVVKIIGTNLSLQLNRTSVTGGQVLDWKQTSLTTNPLVSAGVDLGPTDPTFRIGGTVGLSIADVVLGNAVVAVSRSVAVSYTHVALPTNCMVKLSAVQRLHKFAYLQSVRCPGFLI